MPEILNYSRNMYKKYRSLYCDSNVCDEETEYCCGENKCCERTNFTYLWIAMTLLLLAIGIAAIFKMFMRRRKVADAYRYQLVTDQIRAEES